MLLCISSCCIVNNTYAGSLCDIDSRAFALEQAAFIASGITSETWLWRHVHLSCARAYEQLESMWRRVWFSSQNAHVLSSTRPHRCRLQRRQLVVSQRTVKRGGHAPNFFPRDGLLESLIPSGIPSLLILLHTLFDSFVL